MTIDDIRREVHEAALNACTTNDALGIINDVLDFFEGDEGKAIFWFETANPQLGGKTPLDMIRMGRFQKLASFVRTSLEEDDV